MKRISIILSLIFVNLSIVNAQTMVVPIVEIRTSALLGGVQNGRFLDAKTTAAKLSVLQDYKLFLLDGLIEDLSLQKPVGSEPEGEFDQCQDYFGINLSGKDPDYEFNESELDAISDKMKRAGVALGIGYAWKPQPRPQKAIGLDSTEYKKVVMDFLRTKRIANHDVKLEQAVRVDLDGDGTEEVLLTATRYFPYTEKDQKKTFDEYSVVLLRKIVNGSPQTILVAGEIYPKNKSEYDGNFFGLSSIIDLNGDGKLELVVYSEYDEGRAAQVFQIQGNKVVEVAVLSAGCGV